jgi:hypothetical protein
MSPFLSAVGLVLLATGSLAQERSTLIRPERPNHARYWHGLKQSER